MMWNPLRLTLFYCVIFNESNILMLSDVVPCEEGYRISFWPCKQTDVPKMETFLIPKKPEGASGVDYYSFFHAYVECINSEIKPAGHDTFWYTGTEQFFTFI